MIRPRWRKVLRDLWINKSRTIVVVLSIAVGVFAVGAIITSQIILSNDLQEAYLATNPANATIMTYDPFGNDVVDAVRGIREIKEAEARNRVTVRAKTGPDEWRLLMLYVLPDYNDIKIDYISPEQGAWPPPNNEMLIERAALGLLKADMGDTITIKTALGKKREIRIAGLVHDLNAQLFVFDGTSYGFITVETLKWLGEENNYNEMKIVVAEGEEPLTKDYIRTITNKARDKIEAGGRSIFFTFIPEPGKHPLNFLIQSISIIMGALGVFSLILSGFLVINTISSLLTQQTRQIGMMKAVGASTSQVMGIYLVTTFIFGFLSLIIAVPLGAVGAYFFSSYMASFLNFDVNNFRLPAEALAAQVVIGLLIPLLAALLPILAGAKVTVREAIDSYGLGKGRFGTGFIDRTLLKIQNISYLKKRISRPIMISLRNTFRRKGRLALTLITLTLAGTIFIAVFSVRSSLLDTLDGMLDYFNYDIGIQLDRSYRIERVTKETLKVPGVVGVESWGLYNTRRKKANNSDSNNIFLFAPPAETKLIKPTLLEGRWLLPGDTNALVVNSILIRNEPDVKLGSEIILKIGGRESSWQVVGIAKGGTLVPSAFANYPYFARVAHKVNQSNWVYAITDKHDTATQMKVGRAIERHFERIGLGVDMIMMMSQEREETVAIFEVIVVMLLIMAVILAIIGGLGLMGTMSANVLERIREIGVMRAIGASNRSVRWVFISEGIIIGLISWFFGAILSYPISRLLSHVVGTQFLGTALDHSFSIVGTLIWLVVVMILSAVASFLPAWNASRITVREVLAYE